MNRRTTAILIALLLAAVCATTALAQQQGADPRNAMREKYKYTFQLMQMAGHIGEIDKDKKYTLTLTQAKQVLAVLKPLRGKPKLTQDQAKKALKDLKKVFTAAQLNAMARIKPKFQPAQNRERPSGQPRDSDGQRRQWDPNAMKDFNPFYAKAPKGDKRAEERVKRWNEFFAGLEKKAKAK